MSQGMKELCSNCLAVTAAKLGVRMVRYSFCPFERRLADVIRIGEDAELSGTRTPKRASLAALIFSGPEVSSCPASVDVQSQTRYPALQSARSYAC
jgi:hypothetical protein